MAALLFLTLLGIASGELQLVLVRPFPMFPDFPPGSPPPADALPVFIYADSEQLTAEAGAPPRVLDAEIHMGGFVFETTVRNYASPYSGTTVVTTGFGETRRTSVGNVLRCVLSGSVRRIAESIRHRDPASVQRLVREFGDGTNLVGGVKNSRVTLNVCDAISGTMSVRGARQRTRVSVEFFGGGENATGADGPNSFARFETSGNRPVTVISLVGDTVTPKRPLPVKRPADRPLPDRSPPPTDDVISFAGDTVRAPPAAGRPPPTDDIISFTDDTVAANLN